MIKISTNIKKTTIDNNTKIYKLNKQNLILNIV